MNRRIGNRTAPIPVLVDNGLNRAFAVKYFIYSAFGLTGMFTSIPSLAEVSGSLVAQAVAGCVAVSAAVAMVGAWNYHRGIRWIKLEVYSTWFLISFILVYNIALIYLSLSGDPNRTNLAVLALAFLVMPIWRLRDLIKKGK